MLAVSVVHAGFVIKVADGFELEGGVFNVEVAGEAGLDLVEDLGGVTVVEALGLHDNMGGQRG